MKDYNLNTIKHIADKVELSVSTVSRVLNGKAKKYRISDETSEIILKAAKELNYTPNLLARGLRLNKTFTIGYIIPDIANPFFSRIADNVEKYARKKGYSVVLCDSEEDANVEKSSVQTMADKKIDGMIISPVGQEIQHILDLKKKKIPIVFIDRYFPGKDIPFVTSENYKGAFEAVKHLIENGHERIACIQGLKETLPIMERVRGYIAALKYYNNPVDESLIVGDNFSEQNGYIETKLLLKKSKAPTAIFGLSNLISFGAMRALREEGLAIPGDISLITFDDLPYLDFLSTPMSAVEQQGNEIGNIATKMLIDQIESGKNYEAEGIFVPTKLIARSSVKKING